MKKIVFAFCVLAAMLLSFSACQSKGGSNNSKLPEFEGTLIEADYGTYYLPDGWVDFEEISSRGKVFYLKDGTDTSTVTSNISVELGKNKYAAEDHIKFRDAINKQLAQQVVRVGATVTGSGTGTASGDAMYIFTIEEDDVITTQYYVVGEKRYVLVHATDYFDENITDVTEIAAKIADSFVWN